MIRVGVGRGGTHTSSHRFLKKKKKKKTPMIYTHLINLIRGCLVSAWERAVQRGDYRLWWGWEGVVLIMGFHRFLRNVAHILIYFELSMKMSKKRKSCVQVSSPEIKTILIGLVWMFFFFLS